MDSQRRFIAQSAYELAPKTGDKVGWLSPLVGRFTLLNIDNIRKRNFDVEAPYFELRAGLRIDPEINRIPFELYMFHSGGDILGIIRNLAQTRISAESSSEFISSTNFQLENGLIGAGQEDYDKLELYLKNGKLDALRNG